MNRYIALCCCLVGISSNVQSQTKTCTFNFTNNTGETLTRALTDPTYSSEDYSITSNLPVDWRNGETYTLTFEAHLDAYALLTLATASIPTIDFYYSGLTGGPYGLKLAVFADFASDGQPSASASKCMISDKSREDETSPVDFCKGADKNGDPLFCVETGGGGLDVSIGYGVDFLQYDHNYDPSDEGSSGDSNPTTATELPNPATLLPIRILPQSDPDACVTSSDMPFSFDVFVRPLDYDPGAGQIPALRSWQYAPDIGSFYMGNAGYSLDYCLGATHLAAGAEVRTDKCSQQQAKKWLFAANGQIQSQENTNLCLTRESNDKLRLRSCSDTNSDEKWQLELNAGSMLQSIHPASHTGKCLYAGGWEKDVTSNVDLRSCSENEGQKWFFDGTALRLSYRPNKCLDLDHSQTANGTNIQLWNCNGTDAQRWIYDVANQMIRSRIDTSKCLDRVNGRTADGTNIQLYDCVYGNTKPNQQWTIDGVPATMPDTTARNQRIHLVLDRDKCVAARGGSTDNGTNIRLRSCGRLEAQYFIFDGRQIKMQKDTSKCIDLYHSNKDKGTNIQIYDCNGTKAQQWIYDGLTRAFRSAVDLDKCMDLENSQTDDNTNIRIWNCNDTDAQRFEIY